MGFVNFSIAFFRVIIREKYMAAEITSVSSALKTRLLAFALPNFPKTLFIAERIGLAKYNSKKPARKVTNLPTYLI